MHYATSTLRQHCASMNNLGAGQLFPSLNSRLTQAGKPMLSCSKWHHANLYFSDPLYLNRVIDGNCKYLKAWKTRFESKDLEWHHLTCLATIMIITLFEETIHVESQYKIKNVSQRPKPTNTLSSKLSMLMKIQLEFRDSDARVSNGNCI